MAEDDAEMAPSSSSLSDAPMTEPSVSTATPSRETSHIDVEPESNTSASLTIEAQPTVTDDKNITVSHTHTADSDPESTPRRWDLTQHSVEQMDNNIVLSQSDKITTPRRGGKGGRPRKVANSSTRSSLTLDGANTGAEVERSLLARGSARSRTGRAKGRGRGGSRGGKRKRNDDDDDDDASDSSEVVTPIATTTKSGRSIQKPVSLVLPQPSPPTTKRKRPFQRRNTENAVCKTCLRGTSPASNMIVFCDGCNSPYHRYCHKPPIDQAVIDEVDKEWHCRHCKADRVAPVPEADVADFVSAPLASVEQKRRYFSSLTPGTLVTLLTKATRLHPDLPVFTPDFLRTVGHPTSEIFTSLTPTAPSTVPNPNSNSTQVAQAQHAAEGLPAAIIDVAKGSVQPYIHENTDDEDEDNPYNDPDQHPPNYPRPGQGLMSTLANNEENSKWLVDPDDARNGVFTHLYQTPRGSVVPASQLLPG